MHTLLYSTRWLSVHEGFQTIPFVACPNEVMTVPVTPEGRLTFEDGLSAPGRYVELLAERDVRVLISNCPQLNNPCNAYNPTPVRLLVWSGNG